MAVNTSALIMGGAALAGSGYQFSQGKRQEKQAKRALNDFERQELSNIYDDMPISLLASDLRREDASQTTANLTEAARGSGIRGVFGALPRIQTINNQASRQNQVDVDNQVMRRNYAIAGDEGRIQGMQEARDDADLAGIGQQLAVGQQNTMNGIRGAFNGLGLLGSGFTGQVGGNKDTEQNIEQRPQDQTVKAFNTNPVPVMGNPIKLADGTFAPILGAPIGSYMPGVNTFNNEYQKYLIDLENQNMLNQVAPKNFR